MTDEEVIRAVQQIKATASPAGGVLAERLGDEILSLNAKRKLVFDAWESDRKEIEAFKKALTEIAGVCTSELEDESHLPHLSWSKALSIAEKALNG